MKRLLSALLGVLFVLPAYGNFASFQTSITPVCSAGALDTFAASPGTWTAAYSHRKLRTAYVGSGLQLQRSSDNTTLNIGFIGCDPAPTPSISFCSTASLAVGTTSSNRIAYPSGTVIHVFNVGPSPIFYASGNGSVTATTASNELNFRSGVNITVGVDTNIAALIGTGYGINGGNGSATLFLTNCGVSKIYDQSGNSNDVAQTTLANQLGYMPNAQGVLPLAFGCLSGCNLHAVDSATYKTSIVNTFTVMTFGEDITTSPFSYSSVVYPATTSDFLVRWGLINAGAQDTLIPEVNSNINQNNEGFGGVWRGQNLTQYDYSTEGVTRWNGGTQFMSFATATPTYPNAVGLYIMGNSQGDGTPGTFAEALVASGTQTSRNSISANQVSYWGITTGTAATIALTNPLSDGFNWNQIQIGSFAPNPPGSGNFTVNGNSYASEAAWNDYSQWSCTNCISTGGRLGDLWRFQQTFVDVWDGTNRTELDGSSHATCNQNVDCWYSYAVWIEPGTAYSASWNIVGQNHTTNAGICCTFNINLQNDQFVFHTDNLTTETTQYTSPTITRGIWYHIVIKMHASSSGSADTFDQWSDFVTPGTMVHNVAATGAIYAAANTQSYWKYGNYRETAVRAPTLAIRYGNMQMCTSGTDCTNKYGASDLSANTTTPLANPSH